MSARKKLPDVATDSIWALKHQDGTWRSPDHYVSSRVGDPKQARPFFGPKGFHDAHMFQDLSPGSEVVSHPHPEVWTSEMPKKKFFVFILGEGKIFGHAWGVDQEAARKALQEDDPDRYDEEVGEGSFEYVHEEDEPWAYKLLGPNAPGR